MILNLIHRNGKAIVVGLALLLMTTLGYSQTGIGITEPDPDAQLEISAPNKGVLIPRIELTGTDSVAPLSSHVAGMIVYNTITAGSGSTAVVPGFYYNDGTKWVRTLGAGEVIAGNSGLSSGIGEPNATNPASPDVGDVYIDESTGDVYTYVDTDNDGEGDTWENQSDVVSTDADNIIVEGSDGLAYLSAAELGIYTGTGAPTATEPTDTPEAGDVYVDETTGDIYTYNGMEWIRQPEAKITVGTGEPTDTDPANPAGGDIYVDESTGDVYTYNSVTNMWENQSDVVSTDADNIIVEGSDGLAYLSAAELGIYTGTGAPTATEPTDTPEAGDVYVDETTGDIYTYNGMEWIRQPEAKITVGTGEPTDTDPANPAGGDIYVDESTGDVYTYNSVTNMWENQSDALANNGLSVDANNTVQLGGTLIQPTTITTDATNTLAVEGLETATANYDVMVVDNTTGVVQKVTSEDLELTRYVQEYIANDGEIDFTVPQPITVADLDKIDAYRNGVRVDIDFVDANTIKLDLDTPGCYAGDQIRIVQLQ